MPDVIASNVIITKTHFFLSTMGLTFAFNLNRFTVDWFYPSGGTSLMLTSTGKLIIVDKQGRISAIALH